MDKMTIPEYLVLIEANRQAARADQLQKRLDGYLQALNDLARGSLNGKPFEIFTGRKYWKIVRNNSVHAFVDRKTGRVFKAAGWAQPAKGVRFDLMEDDSYMDLINRADLYGGYLYK